MYVEYNSNNSGGDWWLDDDDWKALENAGWKVCWAGMKKVYDDGKTVIDADGMPLLADVDGNELFAPKKGAQGTFRWLGAVAREAYRAGIPMRDAAKEWESITGKSSTEAGCPCCGQPHYFTEYDDNGRFVDSGPNTHYEAAWS